MIGVTEQTKMPKKPNKPVRSGVAASLAVGRRGRIRVVLDDVEESSTGWKMIRLYTWKDLLLRDLRDMSLSERDLASLGLAVVARLRAVWGKGKRMRKPTSRRTQAG